MKKNSKKIISIFLVIVTIFSLVPIVLAKDSGEELADSKHVLLIQDRMPWDSQANMVVLDSINAIYGTTTTSKFSSDMLSDYGVVILANDQTTSTYDAYGRFTAELETFVKNGGTVVYGACDEGWGNGYLSSKLPGGVKKAKLYDNRNYIVDRNHPIVTGVLTDSSELSDNDLYSNYCSHVYFCEDTLPVGSNIILRSKSNDAPTLIEYPMGEGMVIASGLTWEHNYVKHRGYDEYGTFALKAMDDYFAYAIQYYNSTIAFSVNNCGINLENLKYNDTYFNSSSYIYNHELAKASMGLATAAMASDGKYVNPEAASKLFNDLDFDNYEPYNYTNEPGTNTIACVIASKNIDETKMSIISIGIRGGGYESEWGGNFNVGNKDVHVGFDLAKKGVLEYLDSFLIEREQYGDIKYKNNVKFWISGYSRAAATANLVSASLHNGTYIDVAPELKSFDFSENDIFTYTFETPRNTRDKNAKDDRYSNIFNIINREDPVPLVAPSSWKYVRYGKDCYLPSQDSNPSEYDRLLPEMKRNFKEVAKKDYEEFFKNNSFQFKEIGLTGLKTNQNISKGVYLNNLIKYIAQEFKSSKNYEKVYQESIVSLATITKGNIELIGKKLGFAWKQYMDKNKNIKISKLAGDAKAILVDVIYDVAKENSKISKKKIKKMVDEATGDILNVVIKHPNYIITTFNNADNLANAHFTQETAAWLYAIDGDYKDEGDSLSKILTGGETYRIATINCPVDVYVYDENDALKGAIVDNETLSILEEPLNVYLDENGQKCICLPNEEKYTIKISGTDNGTMTCSFAEYNFDKNEKETGKNYYSIPINCNSEFTAFISKKSDTGIVEDVELIDNISGTAIEASEIVNYENENPINISVKTNEEDCLAIGGGRFLKGEFVQISAVLENGYVFLGWYVDDEFITDEMVYRFPAEKDQEIIAKFEKDSHYCKYCNKIHSGFWGKIVMFFHNIFYKLKNINK